MLYLVLACHFPLWSLYYCKDNKGYFMFASISLPQLLHIDPKNQTKHKNATASLAIAFTVKYLLKLSIQVLHL